MNTVLEAFKGTGNRMNMLVLDACRDVRQQSQGPKFRGNRPAWKMISFSALV